MYIVMLPHLPDISKIEVRVKDQYKLKVNTKKANEQEEMRVFGIHLPCRALFQPSS